MSPVSNPLKAAASTSTHHESGSAKKSRLNDDFIEVKRESMSPTNKFESDYLEEYDVKTNEIADSTHMKHLDVGISIKPKSTFIAEPHKPVKAGNYEKETDPMVLTRREKQIEYGKNTPEYANYLAAVPKDKREQFHPKTPNKYRKYSRRAWDGLIRQWRLNLHCWSDAPLEDLESFDQIKREHNDSFCSEDTNVSASTSSSVAAAFTAGLGIHSSQEDLKSISRSGSVSFPDYEDDVDVKPDIKDILRVKIEDEMNVTLKNDDEMNEGLMMPQADGPLKNATTKIKLESSDIGNTSWADEVEDELWTDGEPTP